MIFSRLAALKDDFASALRGADQVVVTEVNILGTQSLYNLLTKKSLYYLIIRFIKFVRCDVRFMLLEK